MLDRSVLVLRELLKPRWSDARAARVRHALEARTRRRRALVVVLPMLTVAMLATGALRLRSHPAATGVVRLATTSAQRAPAPRASPLEATATPLGPDSELSPDPDGAGRSFSVRRGGARFVVAHDMGRPFRVHVGPVIIEDMGTTFSVHYVPDATVEVIVEEGRVRVVLGAQVQELEAGQRRTFDVRPAATAGPLDTDKTFQEPSASSLMPGASQIAAWRPLAENGHYREAYEWLSKGGRRAVRDETGELLLAADAARLSGHPASAVPFLEQVLAAHKNDPRAGLAAFTLGRIELEELGHPAQAAAAFERARSAGGPLAEDALAREVEAFSRAGESARARELALEYERVYPKGRREIKVRKFGGLE